MLLKDNAVIRRGGSYSVSWKKYFHPPPPSFNCYAFIKGVIMSINAVITYRDNGTRRPCGQIVGADGRGDYAVLFELEGISNG